MTLVALVEDHLLFAASVGVALRAQGLEVLTPPLSSLEDVRDELLRSRPRVVLLDRDLGPLGDGEDLIAPLNAAGAAVIVVSAALDEIAAGRCLARGAVACLPKTAPLDELLSTVASAADGVPTVGEAERSRLISQWRRWEVSRKAAMAPLSQLTPREASVLGRLIEGKAVKEIARESYVTEATVRTQVRAILQKLRVNSQLEAVALASRVGWRPSGR